MWQDSVETAMLWQSALETLPLTALRVLAWLLIGFAIVLAGGLAGMIATLASEWRHDHPVRAMR